MDRDRSARHPDRRRASTCCRPAARRKDGKAIPYVSDFFDFSIYLDADEDVLLQLVRGPVPDAARHRVPRSEIVLPPLCDPVRRRGGRDRDLDLDADQPGQSAREHPADAPARRPHPEEGRQPPGRGSGAARVVGSSAWSVTPSSRAIAETGCTTAAVRMRFAHAPMRSGAVDADSASRSRSAAAYCLRVHLCPPYEAVRFTRDARRPAPAPRQPLAVERLGEESVHAGGQAGVAILVERIGGERDDRRAPDAALGLDRADAARGFDAVAARHVHVHQHEVVGRAGRLRGQPGSDRGFAASPRLGRWPSRCSSACASSALISLSSATRIASPRLAGSARIFAGSCSAASPVGRSKPSCSPPSRQRRARPRAAA